MEKFKVDEINGAFSPLHNLDINVEIQELIEKKKREIDRIYNVRANITLDQLIAATGTAPDDLDFSMFDVEEIHVSGSLVGDPVWLKTELEGEDQICKIDPPTISQKELIDTFATVDIMSAAFVSRPFVYPYVRQHRTVPETGTFYFEGMPAVFSFPPIGNEYFIENQFRNKLGVDSVNGIVALNNIYHILYAVKVVPLGSEFIVFQVVTDEVTVYFLWDDIGIRRVKARDVAYGMKDRDGDYHIISGEVFTLDKVVKKCEWYYPVRSLFVNCPPNATLLLNIDGLEYYLPRDRVVVFFKSKGKMVDGSGLPYVVDYLPYGAGFYRYQNDQWHFICATSNKSSPTKFVEQMCTTNTVVDDFLLRHRIPDGDMKLCPIIRDVRVMAECIPENIIAAERAGVTPYVKRKGNTTSKATLITSTIESKNNLELDTLKVLGPYISAGKVIVGSAVIEARHYQSVILYKKKKHPVTKKNILLLDAYANDRPHDQHEGTAEFAIKRVKPSSGHPVAVIMRYDVLERQSKIFVSGEELKLFASRARENWRHKQRRRLSVKANRTRAEVIAERKE